MSDAAPRRAHLEMVGAVVAGEGLERVAEIASAHAGAPVAVVVPRLGSPREDWRELERYVGSRLAGGRPPKPPEVEAEVPIASGQNEIGAVLLLGRGGPDFGEYLHVAALAALTEVAVAEAREETEQRLRGSFLEELLRAERIDEADVLRRAARLGCDLAGGYQGLCADPRGRSPGRLLAVVASEAPGSVAQVVEDKLYALLPGEPEQAQRVANRLARHALAGLSSRYASAADARSALEEADLVLSVTAAGGEVGEQVDGVYRLLFRALVSHPDEVRAFYDDTVAALVAYDREYSTDMLGTLHSYLAENCNMNATARAVHAHRHTVAYRLDRVKELTGLDPLTVEDRERLGLGLKAYRIIAPSLPR
ncbi:MAG: PucR family transcriptional regulator [Thermoleophilaceae bacterium]